MTHSIFSLPDYLYLGTDKLQIFVLCAAILVISSAVFFLSWDFKKKRPPGPIGLPFFGFLPFLGNAPHETFAKLVKKYGPVIRVKLGFMDCVVLGTYDAIKEALVKQSDTCSGRPDYMNIKVYDNETAFVYREGDEWKDLRKFSVHALKKLGFGRESLEPIVQTEIQYFIEALKQKEAASPKVGFPIAEILQKSISNAICSLFLGHRCEYSDPWLDRVVQVVREIHDTYVHDVTLFFSWMVKVPLLSKLVINPKKRILKDALWDLWRQKVTEFHNNEQSKADNFLSLWMEEYNRRRSKNDPKCEDFSEFSLVSNIDILCQASFETTATTVQWAILVLLIHPEIQQKLQKEIDSVIGQDRVPQYVDAKDMPYTRAFITENHRKTSLLPLSLFHCTRDSTFLMGYWIPKRTIIISNQWAVHHDPALFPDPEKFDPDRYLDKNGQFVRPECIIPFSMGKRHCPGESVAEMEIFLYLTCLLQKYTIIPPPGTDLDYQPTYRFLVRPKPFNICLQPR